MCGDLLFVLKRTCFVCVLAYNSSLIEGAEDVLAQRMCSGLFDVACSKYGYGDVKQIKTKWEKA